MQEKINLKNPKFRGIITQIANKLNVSRGAVSQGLKRNQEKYLIEFIKIAENRQNKINKLNEKLERVSNGN